MTVVLPPSQTFIFTLNLTLALELNSDHASGDVDAFLNLLQEHADIRDKQPQKALRVRVRVRARARRQIGPKGA